jgi:hypothetical protein
MSVPGEVSRVLAPNGQVETLVSLPETHGGMLIRRFLSLQCSAGSEQPTACRGVPRASDGETSSTVSITEAQCQAGVLQGE